MFSPVLTAGENGNIYNVSDPDELVIGYVEVASVARKEMYISAEAGLYVPEEDAYHDCEIFLVKSGQVIPSDLVWYRYPDSKTYPSCVDCRAKPGATKNRPAWWPNEHY